MRNASRDFLIGLVTIAAAIGMVLLLVRFGELDLLRRDRYVVTLQTDRSGGLRPGSPVELHGIPIGVVDRIQLNGSRTHPVNITLRISREVEILEPMRLFVQASVLGGTSILELEPAVGAVQALPTDNTALVTSDLRSRLVDDTLQTLEAFATPLLTAAERFSELSETYIRVGESVNDLLRGEGGDGEASLRDVIVRLDTTLAQTQRTAELLGDWLDDAELRAGLNRVVVRSDAVLGGAEETMERYRQLADQLDDRTGDLAETVVRAGDALAGTLEEVRVLTARMTDGPGTVARLLNDPDLHISLIDAATRLELVLMEAQLLIEKARAEGIRLGF